MSTHVGVGLVAAKGTVKLPRKDCTFHPQTLPEGPPVYSSMRKLSIPPMPQGEPVLTFQPPPSNVTWVHGPLAEGFQSSAAM